MQHGPSLAADAAEIAGAHSLDGAGDIGNGIAGRAANAPAQRVGVRQQLFGGAPRHLAPGRAAIFQSLRNVREGVVAGLFGALVGGIDHADAEIVRAGGFPGHVLHLLDKARLGFGGALRLGDRGVGGALRLTRGLVGRLLRLALTFLVALVQLTPALLCPQIAPAQRRVDAAQLRSRQGVPLRPLSFLLLTPLLCLILRGVEDRDGITGRRSGKQQLVDRAGASASDPVGEVGEPLHFLRGHIDLDDGVFRQEAEAGGDQLADRIDGFAHGRDKRIADAHPGFAEGFRHQVALGPGLA